MRRTGHLSRFESAIWLVAVGSSGGSFIASNALPNFLADLANLLIKKSIWLGVGPT
ncbi:MAG: hypothetical protein IPG51_18300 [Chloroflexi bacterium]|nr:hypothetical protein [Chloroflexota bacterium]